ncbi:unnamed protein product [Polarella glacialis]|uniref:PROP1-like PPR domain-containing protein n=1 Tax=Polarella glacialis TaxID=89957 RepID=A0A813HI91_POLGL|nr:unnamed protein product [Polarella glacialis]
MMSLMQALNEFLGTAGVELFVFLVAFLAHALVFGKRRLALKPKAKEAPEVFRVEREAQRCSEKKNTSGRAGLLSQSDDRAVEERDDRAAQLADEVATIKRLARKEQLSTALAYFQGLSPQQPALYVAMIETCAECNDLAAVQQVWEEAKAAGFLGRSVQTAVLKASLRIGKTQQAVELLHEMRKTDGLKLSASTFNELLDSLAKGETGWEDAWLLVDEMKTSELRPTNVTCSILLKRIQKGSRALDVEKALAVVNGVPKEEVDEVLLNCVCEACIRAARSDLLLQQLERHQGSTCLQIRGSHTFGSIIRAHGVVGNLAGVWKTWKEMRRRHVTLTSITLGCMVEALASNHSVEAGYELIRETLRDPETRQLVNAVIYCSVLKGFCHEKRFDRVWSVYEEMLQEQVQFSVATFNALLDACARSGEMYRAEPLLKEMAEQSIQANIVTYSTVLKGYCIENRVDKAFGLMQEMKLNTEVKADEVMYNTLLDGCARCCLWEKGMSVLSEMRKQGINPSNFTLSVLVKLANRCKKPVDVAFNLCQDLCQTFCLRPNIQVYNNLIHVCTNQRQLQRALDVFGTLLSERVRPDSRTYALLLRGCVQGGAAQEAVDLLCLAVGLRQQKGAVAGKLNVPAAMSKMLFSGPSGATCAKLPSHGIPQELLTEVLEFLSSHKASGSQAGKEQLLGLVRQLRSAPGVSP